MSSAANGALVIIALIAILTFMVVLAVFVLMIVTLTKVNGIAGRTRPVAPRVDMASASAISTVVQGLRSENASLQSKLQLADSELLTAESRAEAAERAAESATNATRDQLRRGVEKARTKEFVELQEKMRGVELHNLALHQECADLRAQLAKTGKRAAANNTDLNETEQLLEKASRSLVTVSTERDAARREIAILRVEIEKLNARLSAPIDRPAVTTPQIVREMSVALPGTPPPSKATPPEPGTPPKARPAPKTASEPKPAIVTRTSSTATSGVSEFDDVDKQWNEYEDSDLLTAYLASRDVAATADAIQVDQKQVALRLITLLLGPHGAVDYPTAQKHGKTYSAADSKAIVQAWRDGRKLPAIARDFERDQLGIGWKLLDHSDRPVELTADMIPDIVDEVHR